MTDFWKKCYNSSSITIKFIAFVPYFRVFLKTYVFLKKTQYWNQNQIAAYQDAQLRKLIFHAYTNVPYYKRLFDEHGISPEDIQKTSDIHKIPFLTKEIVRENLEDLKAKNFHTNDFEYVTTGGTSGMPMGFFYEKGTSRAIEWAFIKTLWDRVGYHFFDKCVYLKGSVLQSENEIKMGKKTFFNRVLVLSSFYLTDEYLDNYVRIIRKFKPRFIQAYPSSITQLAQFMKNNNYQSFNTLEAIFCGSENMYPGQRELIEKVFKCKVYTWYGHAERVVLAGECESSHQYHIFPEYGIFELVNDKGDVINQSQQEGTIVGTGFTNYAMPLIRYKTDDKAVFSEEIKCQCNREYKKIENVKGRWNQEFIIAPNNRKISITSLNMHSDIFDNVKQYQFYQEKVGEVILKIVPYNQYCENDNNNIHAELGKKIGNDIILKIKLVEEISRTETGKYKFINQKIKN